MTDSDEGLRNLQMEISESKALLQAREAELKAANEEASSQAANAQRLHAELQKSQEQVNELRRQKTTADSRLFMDLEKAQKDAQIWRDKAEAAGAGLAGAQAHIDRLEVEQEATETRTMARVKQLEERCERLNSSLLASQLNEESLSREAQDYAVQLVDAQTSLQKLQLMVNQYQAMASEMQSKLADACWEVTSTRDTLKAMRAEQNEATKLHEERTRELQSQVTRLEQQIQQLSASVAESSSKARSAMQLKDTADARAARLEQQLARLEAEAARSSRTPDTQATKPVLERHGAGTASEVDPRVSGRDQSTSGRTAPGSTYPTLAQQSEMEALKRELASATSRLDRVTSDVSSLDNWKQSARNLYDKVRELQLLVVQAEAQKLAFPFDATSSQPYQNRFSSRRVTRVPVMKLLEKFGCPVVGLDASVDRQSTTSLDPLRRKVALALSAVRTQSSEMPLQVMSAVQHALHDFVTKVLELRGESRNEVYWVQGSLMGTYSNGW